MGIRAFKASSLETLISFFPVFSTSSRFCREFIPIHGQLAQLWQVAPSPTVGASIRILSGANCLILLKIPASVATMNSRFGMSVTALIRAVVEPTTSASSMTASVDSGCTRTAASGCSFFSLSRATERNSSWTTQDPGQKIISAPESFCTYLPRCLSGPQRIFSPFSARCLMMGRAIPEVTTQSERAFTSALVLA